MSLTKPNRMREQDADPNEAHQKKSGDQHTLPIDEPDEAPYRPHRINRQDLQKPVLPEIEGENAPRINAPGKK